MSDATLRIAWLGAAKHSAGRSTGQHFGLAPGAVWFKRWAGIDACSYA